MKEKIRILNESLLDEKYWNFTSASKHLTGHMYFRSPFETDDSCGNCDGGRCDVCRTIVDEPEFEFSIESGKLYKLCVENGMPEDVASEICYSDDCGWSYKGYTLKFPTQTDLINEYPDFYKKLSTIDDNIREAVNELLNEVARPGMMNELETKLSEIPKERLYNQYRMIMEEIRNDK